MRNKTAGVPDRDCKLAMLRGTGERTDSGLQSEDKALESSNGPHLCLSTLWIAMPLVGSDPLWRGNISAANGREHEHVIMSKS